MPTIITIIFIIITLLIPISTHEHIPRIKHRIYTLVKINLQNTGTEATIEYYTIGEETWKY